MILLNSNLLDEVKKTHPHLTSATDRFRTLVEAALWDTPQDVKNTFGRHADWVSPFWIIDVGGKKGARIILQANYRQKIVLIKKIWLNHDEYMSWSKETKK
jgi:mRNA-degrading endonuclease HigB of HigAB toxin-antitoxin module